MMCRIRGNVVKHDHTTSLERFTMNKSEYAHIALDMSDATLVESSYGDPLLRVPGLNPFQRYPERSEWTEHEVWTLIDGQTVRLHREVYRWGGTVSSGKWEVVTAVSYRFRWLNAKKPDAWVEGTKWSSSIEAVRAKFVSLYGSAIEVEVL
jgi:hypothetical protein